MMRRRMLLTAGAMLALLAIWPSSGSANAFSFRPCADSIPLLASRNWSASGTTSISFQASCTGSTYQYLQVPVQKQAGSNVSWLPLGPGRIDELQVVVTGRDLSAPTAQGMDYALAVCTGLDFPADCGTPVRGSTVFPFNPQFVDLSRGDSEIPENADRLVLFAKCLLDDPGICPTSSERVEFSDIWVTAEDSTPPSFDNFESPPSDKWFNTPPDITGDASDPESGISRYVVAANATSSEQYLCNGPTSEFGCPLDASGFSTGGILLKQGRNTASVTATNAAQMISAERKFSFLYDSFSPTPPDNLSAVGANGNWILGSQLRLHWSNGSENLPTATQSGVASADVDIEPAGFHPDPYDSHFEFTSPGIDAAAITLPFEDTWTVRVKTFDAAGNQSAVRSLTIDNEDWLGNPPQSGPNPLPTMNIAGTSGPVTFTWGPGNFGRSGDCGYRGWLGMGEPPALALEPSSQISESGVTSWTLGAPGVARLQDGMNKFALAAVSCSGLVSDNFTRTIRIDRGRPTISASPAARWLPGGSALALDATDPGAPETGSGVASTWYRLDAASTVTVGSDHANVPIAPGAHQLVFGAVDHLGNQSDEKHLSIGVDEQAPSVAMVPGVSTGEFNATIADGVSGVVEAWCEISAVGVNSGKRLGDRFVSSVGRTTPIGLNVRVPDDGSLPPGGYELRVVARDEAGNTQTTVARTLRLPIRPPSSISASVASATHPKVAHKALTLDVGIRSTLRGELLAADGTPIVGGLIRVVAQRDDGAKRVLEELRTGVGGAYSVRLGTDVSRSLAVMFDGDSLRGPASASARVNVRASVSMRLSSKRVKSGGRLFANGRVKLLSATVPPRGVPVEIQYCGRNGCTRVTISSYTDSGGGFSIEIPTSYAARTKLSIRARVRDFPGWPFAEGVSPRRSVVVR